MFEAVFCLSLSLKNHMPERRGEKLFAKQPILHSRPIFLGPLQLDRVSFSIPCMCVCVLHCTSCSGVMCPHAMEVVLSQIGGGRELGSPAIPSLVGTFHDINSLGLFLCRGRGLVT